MSSQIPVNQQQTQQQQQQQLHQASPLPVKFRAISRNNSNTSTASSSNKGEFSSTLSTTNSVTSSRSQLSRPHQLIDHKQLLATCGTSTPIRSFQRATISSVVKTRAFDNNPVLQGLLTATPSGQNSVSNSQTPSPLSTPVFSRSRSLRMSGGPRRYQQSPSHYLRTSSSRTPDLYCYGNSNDYANSVSNDTQAKILELSSEKSELKESLEFLECERQVLIDSAQELKDTLQKERSTWKKELDDLKKQLTDSMAGRIKAESQLTKLDMETNDMRQQSKKFIEDLQVKERQIAALMSDLEVVGREVQDLKAINDELKDKLNEVQRFNGLSGSGAGEQNNYLPSGASASIVTELAILRHELNEKDKIIKQHNGLAQSMLNSNHSGDLHDAETLNKFLDQTVECIKSWPEELAGSSHVQNLMKTLLSAYKPEQDDLSSRMNNIHL